MTASRILDRLSKNVDALNRFLYGSSTDDVSLDGATRPSASKQIKEFTDDLKNEVTASIDHLNQHDDQLFQAAQISEANQSRAAQQWSALVSGDHSQSDFIGGMVDYAGNTLIAFDPQGKAHFERANEINRAEAVESGGFIGGFVDALDRVVIGFDGYGQVELERTREIYPRERVEQSGLIGGIVDANGHPLITFDLQGRASIVRANETTLDERTERDGYIGGFTDANGLPLITFDSLGRLTSWQPDIRTDEDGHHLFVSGFDRQKIHSGNIVSARHASDETVAFVEINDARIEHKIKSSDARALALDATPETLLFIPSTGQSLSVGGGGALTQSPEFPHRAIMFNGGVQGNQWGETTPDQIAYFISLQEGGFGAQVESHNSAMIHYFLSKFDEKSRPLVLGRGNGAGGANFEEIKKNGRARVYSDAIIEAKRAAELAAKHGKKPKIPAFTLTHGEDDSDNGTSVNYGDYFVRLRQLVDDYQADYAAITGQSEKPIAMIDQVGSRPDNPVVAIDQWRLTLERDDCMMPMPKWPLNRQFGYDMSHLKNAGYRRLGEYIGRALHQALAKKKPWQPLQPKKGSISGQTITIDFHVPSPPLVIDTDTFGACKNHGFEFIDDDNSAEINRVQLSGRQIILTLNQLPTGKNPRVLAGYTADDVSDWGRRYPKICLRDSSPDVSRYDSARLYNWCVLFLIDLD